MKLFALVLALSCVIAYATAGKRGQYWPTKPGICKFLPGLNNPLSEIFLFLINRRDSIAGIISHIHNYALVYNKGVFISNIANLSLLEIYNKSFNRIV